MTCIECGAATGDMHRGKCNPDNREGYAWMVLFEDTFLEFEPVPDAHLDDMGD
ncbi:hypothetical protein SEA_SAMISTI12_264 [Streptomyces phage Samisti12]|uniref:Uncharacterized protein n=2 Tax=Samistivirus TaxID=2560220 RepID=A0A411B6I5_9CAUD|nr:hypothetical protein FDI39_gp013 [Streptomyces phage Samisti12]YP_009611657.1 hypothetical protein FDI39_gp045 [Streptomyces phage Samisti12]QAX95751.1 hypothetical protein SEA_TEUTSCH_14 [Streptomyces phage Teutsch]AST15245.1 hypothetical protein SEA_SAMISTI12_13 [Streptomyces phage Samisti12]AST15449.1 hypothetical protein SEA_SAMISTI12_264 [Streptomyces phage Samisti12]QAX95951.1 hypothetical protein SEA_TEUTSCH_261 [Streptomyces phage Teutsch]